MQKVVSITSIGVILVVSITAIISTFGFHDHHNRKVFVGSIGLVASVAMYASPLVVVVSFIYILGYFVRMMHLYVTHIHIV